MMWLLAALIVLAMGGVAMLAAGHGAPLRDDTSNSTTPQTRQVPEDRDITPTDLRGVRFSVVVRGYRMSEVDDLLDRLAAQREPASPDDPSDQSRPPDQGGAATTP